jgi:hypothetical protein
MPVVFYGCETWSLILGEEHRLRTFGSMVLRRTFRPKSDEIIEGWKKCIMGSIITSILHQTPIIIMMKSKRMSWAGNVARMGEKRNAYRVLVENPIGKRPLGRPRRGWRDNIKIDVGEISWGGVG